MIEIRVETDSDDAMISYFSKGHAADQFVSDRDALIACNSLSAIEYQFLYSIRILCAHIVTDTAIAKGEFKMNFVIKNISEEEKQILKILSKSFIIGVDIIKKQFPKLINVKISTLE